MCLSWPGWPPIFLFFSSLCLLFADGFGFTMSSEDGGLLLFEEFFKRPAILLSRLTIFSACDWMMSSSSQIFLTAASGPLRYISRAFSGFMAQSVSEIFVKGLYEDSLLRYPLNVGIVTLAVSSG